MASVYPSGLDALSTSHQDNVGELVHAADIDNLADAVNKIETELGILPKGQFSSVAAKLGALFYGQVTTSARDAITNGNRPTGLIVFNTTTNRYEFNAGSQATPSWLPIGPTGPWGTADIVDAAITSAKISDGTIVDADINAAAAILISKLAGYPADATKYLTGAGTWLTLPSSVPSGAISPFAGSAAPTNWLLCDGSAISRSGFATLFTTIGTTYGVGDGSTTFNIPDLRGRIPVGVGTNASVNALGTNDGQTVANRRPHHRTSNSLSTTHNLSLPSHTHPVTGWDTNASLNNGLANTSAQGNAVSHSSDAPSSLPAIPGTVSITGSVGTANANDALDAPSYIVVNYIIKT